MELRQYLHVLRKWLWLVALCAVLAGAAAYGISRRQTPIYQATAELLVSPGSSSSQDYTALLTGERLARTYAQLLTNRSVLEEVASRLELTLSAEALDNNVSVSLVRDTQLIILRVVDEAPERAQSIAATIPEVFAEQSEERLQTRHSSSKQSLWTELESVNADIAAVQARLEALRAMPAPDELEISRLEQALLQYRTTYTNLLRSYEDIRVAEAQSLDTIAVVVPAVLPTSPVGPKTQRNAALAAVVGAMVGVGLAFVLDYLDDTVKTADDVQRTSRLPTLGTIVRFPQSDAVNAKPVMAARPQSSITEGYRVLRTNVQFGTMDKRQSGALLLITSTQPLEGKTTSVANLGVSLAQTGKQVLLVDTDLRRPALHKQFGMTREVGLTSLLLEPELDIERAIQPTEVDGLHVLSSGRVPANASELLVFPETAALLERLRSFADYVLLDSPPVLSAADASILAQVVDGVLLVVETGRTRTDAFRRAVSSLERVKARLLGVLLTKAQSGRDGYYDYYAEYHEEDGRGEDERESNTSARRRLRRLRQTIGRLAGRDQR